MTELPEVPELPELLAVRTFGDPILREVAQPVTVFDEELHTLLDRMHARMDAAGAKGIAGNQVGVLERVFVWRLDAETVGSCVNPEVIWTSEELEAEEEGCLSFPRGFRFLCERPAEARVRYQDAGGETHERVVNGRLARTFLHEIDHLNGVLFIDHLGADDRQRFDVLVADGALDNIPQPYAEARNPSAMEDEMTLNEELSAFAEKFGAAATNGDAEQLTDLYADDALFMTHGLPVAAGRAELHEMFSDDPAPGSMSIVPGELVLDGGDLVVDVGSYVTANHDGTNVRPGKYVAVYRRQSDGRLQLVVHVPVRVA